MYIKQINTDDVIMSNGYYVSSEKSYGSVPDDWEDQDRGNQYYQS